MNALTQREQALFEEQLTRMRLQRKHLFMWLMLAQWVGGIVVTLTHAPGKVFIATVAGAALALPAMALTRLRPGWHGTRIVLAAAQVSLSSLLVHLTDGRIEASFHVFGSMAFIAFYRDVRVLVGATVLLMAQQALWSTWPPSPHLLENWSWVLFENAILALNIASHYKDLRAAALAQASLERSREEYRYLLETTRALPWRFSRDEDRFTSVDARTDLLLGHPSHTWLSPTFLSANTHPDDDAVSPRLRSIVAGGADFEFRLRRADGQWAWLRCIAAEAKDARGSHGLLLDVTTQRQMLFELNQAQKLESVGRLASGIAHEINTPIQFVNDSIHFISDAFSELLPLLGANKAVVDAAREGLVSPHLLTEVADAEEGADLEYLLENVPKALERSVDGLERVATLVRSMKEFGHPSGAAKAPADLNHALQTTLVIARNEYKYLAEVETVFGALPSIDCHIGELNQAFLNIIGNAAHAIGDRVHGTEQRGVIRIETKQVGPFAEIRISDTGGGIPEPIRDRVFEPFFTTKGVGRGTGQGLSIVRNVIVEKHDGTVAFESTVGVGTTFILRLPLEPIARPTQEAA